MYEEKQCKHCGSDYIPGRKDQLYCSNKCKRQAHEIRKLEGLSDTKNQKTSKKGDGQNLSEVALKVQLETLKAKLQHEQQMFELRITQEREQNQQNRDEESLQIQEEMQEDFEMKIDSLEHKISDIFDFLEDHKEAEQKRLESIELLRQQQLFILPEHLENPFAEFVESFVNLVETEEEFQKGFVAELITELKDIRKGVIKFYRKNNVKISKTKVGKLIDPLLDYLKKFHESMDAPALFSPNYYYFDLTELEGTKWYLKLKDYIIYE